MDQPNARAAAAGAHPPRPVIQTWRVSIWDIGLTSFLAEVYDDHTWRLTRIGLQRLGDFELVELARGGPSADLEAEVRAALAAWPGTLTLRLDSPADRRQRWLQRNGRTG
ncbi:hypothetical protein [Burkholderia gladioli]|uniref:hypothetical protein n=1 Tax=Burkholderia gladioli TaxID=28095 RepID=UPI00190423E5|nr:hypothetical protein [Burkholderia gladioli]MBJ9676293.1 hypothetical protein [Burkholderia gladioli]